MDIVEYGGQSDDCGRYWMEHDEAPLIMGGVLFGTHTRTGDYYVCRRHLVEWDASGDSDMLSSTVLTEPIDLEEIASKGFEVGRFIETCTYEWNADNPVYPVGALLFAGDDIEEEVENEEDT